MTAPSVISRQMVAGSTPVSSRTRLQDVAEVGLGELAGGHVDRDHERGLVACGSVAHSWAWRQASSSTQVPTGTMRPVSSRAGMNSPGLTMPRSGSSQRMRASTLTMRWVWSETTGW